MSTTPDPQQPSSPSEGDPTPGTGAGTSDGQAGDAPVYYRPGPSSGHYPQYPQNPYGGQAYGNHPYGRQISGRPETTPAPPPAGYPQPYPPSSPQPYGQAPAGRPRDGAVPRPAPVTAALVLFLVPAALFLIGGLGLAFAPITPEMLSAQPEVDQALAQSGLSMTQFLSFVRTAGAIFAVGAAVYGLLAVVAWLGKFGALVGLTVLTAVFDLFWLVALLGSLGDPVGALVPLVVIALSVGGLVLMYQPPVRAWFTAQRS